MAWPLWPQNKVTRWIGSTSAYKIMFSLQKKIRNCGIFPDSCEMLTHHAVLVSTSPNERSTNEPNNRVKTTRRRPQGHLHDIHNGTTSSPHPTRCQPIMCRHYYLEPRILAHPDITFPARFLPQQLRSWHRSTAASSERSSRVHIPKDPLLFEHGRLSARQNLVWKMTWGGGR